MTIKFLFTSNQWPSSSLLTLSSVCFLEVICYHNAAFLILGSLGSPLGSSIQGHYWRISWWQQYLPQSWCFHVWLDWTWHGTYHTVYVARKLQWENLNLLTCPTFLWNLNMICLHSSCLPQPPLGFGVTCSGVLIHNRVFLTAGHSVNSFFLNNRNLVSWEGCHIDHYCATWKGPCVWVSFYYNPVLLNPKDEDDKCGTFLNVSKLCYIWIMVARGTIWSMLVLSSSMKHLKRCILTEVKLQNALKDVKFLAVRYGTTDFAILFPQEFLALANARYVCFANCVKNGRCTSDQLASQATCLNSTAINWHMDLSTKGFLCWP